MNDRCILKFQQLQGKYKKAEQLQKPNVFLQGHGLTDLPVSIETLWLRKFDNFENGKNAACFISCFFFVFVHLAIITIMNKN